MTKSSRLESKSSKKIRTFEVRERKMTAYLWKKKRMEEHLKKLSSKK